MAEKQAYEEFKKLLRAAIGPDRTQAEFAQETGISPEHLSRMLNSREISRPSRNTLAKIAGHAFRASVTLSDLLSACGYKEAVEAPTPDTADDIQIRVKKVLDTMADGLREMSGKMVPYDNVYDFLKMIDMLYTDCPVSYDISDPVSLEKPVDGAEMYCNVETSWAEKYYSARFGFGIYFTETKGGKVLVCAPEFSMDELVKRGSDAAREADGLIDVEDTPDYVCVVKYKNLPRRTSADKLTAQTVERMMELKESFPDLSNEELLMRIIFGDPNRKQRPMSVEGRGFYVDDVPDYIVINFLNSHKDAFVRSEKEQEIYEKVTSGTPLEEAFHGYGRLAADNIDCWQSAVANIMTRETGIGFAFWSCDSEDEQFGNRACIMFTAELPWYYNEVEKELSYDSLSAAADRYARELRCEYSECYHLMMVDAD
jgi:transcriptional regulator with XRE-family HTH domain